MTFNDIFKSSFLENVTSISILDMALALLLAFGVGLFIFFIYKIVQILGREGLMEKGQATHSSILWLPWWLSW